MPIVKMGNRFETPPKAVSWNMAFVKDNKK